jgi:cation diffusion facilitator CzcD-associated flavoprotein CzcO
MMKSRGGNKELDVVIIGAGMAGIMCAHELAVVSLTCQTLLDIKSAESN